MIEETSSATGPFSVHCRPHRWPWIIVIILGAFTLGGFLIPKAPNTQAWEHLLILGLFVCAFGLPAFLGGLWLSRTAIVADENGLRWRSIGGWRQVQWQQVEDYYALFTRRPEFTTWRIETQVGKIDIREEHFSHTAALRDMVQQHAHWARPKKWETKGLRQKIDWPYTFSYRADGERGACLFFLAISMFWVGFWLWGLVYAFNDVWSYAGPVLAILILIIWFVVISLMPLMAKLMFTKYREFQTHRYEKVTVSVAELIFESGQKQIILPWDDVQDYYCSTTKGWATQDRCVVVGRNGSFDFAKIEEVSLLQKIISQHACQTPFHEWREYRVASITPVKRYDYRNRNVRSLLMGSDVLGTALLIMGAYAQTTPIYGPDTHSNSLVLWIYGGVLGGCFLWLWRHYSVSSITISDEGITQRGWYTEYFLAWEDIKELRTSGSSQYTCCIIGHRKLSFGYSITDYRVLKDEIQRRAVNAEIHPSWNRTTT